MTTDNYSFVHRLTLRVLVYFLHLRVRRAWVAVVGVLGGLPLLRRVVRRFLLTEKISLMHVVAGDVRHRVSELTFEETLGPEFFSRDEHGPVIEATGRFLRGDPFRLGGYPDVDHAVIFQGGISTVEQPFPGVLYLPPRRYHCTLRDAYVNLDYGGICTAKGSMVTDSMPRNRSGSRLKHAWLYGRRRPVRPPALTGCYTTIWGKWAALNYFHWLIDCLPRLDRLRKMDGPPLTLLLPESMPPVWEDSLACCLPKGLAVKRVCGWVRTERLVFSSYGRIQPAAQLNEAERDYIRQAVIGRYNLGSGEKTGRRIYISRSTAHTRRLVNEVEVAGILSDFGFETVHLERLSFEEQVRLFFSADFIAGPHGAGFANLLFAGRAKVLELFADGHFKPLFFFLAHSMGQDHHFMLGSEPNRLGDFRIDTAELKAVVKGMLQRDEGIH